MRIHTSLPVAFLSIGILASAACSEQGTEITTPERTALEAPSDVKFQRQNVGQITQGNLIAALNNVNVNIQDLQALNNLTIEDVQVVNVEDVLNNARILNNSRFLNNITILQDFLNNSLNNINVEILNDALNNNNVVISDVVAIDVLSGGDVIVFTR